MNYLAGKTNSPIPIPEHYPSNIVKGEGPYVFDSNGDRYIDMWMGYGALLFGHADPEIISLVQKNIEKGWFFSYQTELEKEIAQLLHETIPSAERVRFSTSGSDAVAYAIRISRAYTKRTKVLSIIGGYHGVHENMISSNGAISQVLPDKIPFNDVDAVKVKLQSREYACFVLEPVLANAGCTPPMEGYLEAVRQLCSETGTVLVFDEVVTGFRIGPNGAQGYFNVTPDLSTFSKAIAGGFPLSAVCGKQEIMEVLMPTGDVFFAGTFNGHPLSLSITKELIPRLRKSDIYDQTERLGEELDRFVTEEMQTLKIKGCVQGIRSMLTIAFGCTSFAQGISMEGYDAQTYTRFVVAMAKRGVLLPPLPTESIFLSPVHISVIDEVKSAIKECLAEIAARAKA